MTIVEAFACGVPVICSRLGAMQEIVADGRTGLHFTAGDAGDLAQKVEWAWTHSEPMAEMGKEARRQYKAMYTAERNYPLLMEIYQRAMASHRLRENPWPVIPSEARNLVSPMFPERDSSLRSE
jgi:glycosyltransferase involved in cell wall biosynthesis